MDRCAAPQFLFTNFFEDILQLSDLGNEIRVRRKHVSFPAKLPSSPCRTVRRLPALNGHRRLGWN